MNLVRSEFGGMGCKINHCWKHIFKDLLKTVYKFMLQNICNIFCLKDAMV